MRPLPSLTKNGTEPLETIHDTRAIDGLISQKVMRVDPKVFTHTEDCTKEGYQFCVCAGEYACPRFSTEMEDAFEVMQTLAFFNPCLWYDRNIRKWGCSFDIKPYGDVPEILMEVAPTAPLAICLAALKIYGIKPKGEKP